MQRPRSGDEADVSVTRGRQGGPELPRGWGQREGQDGAGSCWGAGVLSLAGWGCTGGFGEAP